MRCRWCWAECAGCRMCWAWPRGQSSRWTDTRRAVVRTVGQWRLRTQPHTVSADSSMRSTTTCCVRMRWGPLVEHGALNHHQHQRCVPLSAGLLLSSYTPTQWHPAWGRTGHVVHDDTGVLVFYVLIICRRLSFRDGSRHQGRARVAVNRERLKTAATAAGNERLARGQERTGRRSEV